MLELVLEDGRRIPLRGELTIGRAADSDLQLDDPSVSRTHARVREAAGGGALLEDAGSSHGTFLDGARVDGPAALRDGARIQIGNLLVGVEEGAAAAGATVVVPVGASLVLPAAGAARPRLRSGHRVKRLAASEGPRRWVVQDLEGGTFLRLADDDGALLELLDGTRELPALVAAAEAQLGAAGPARLARLLADLGDRGLLSGLDGAAPIVAGRPEGWRGWVAPRSRVVPGIGRAIGLLYRAGGRLLLTRPALVVLGAVALAGLLAAAVLVARRYGTPFVVASHLGLGGLVFLAGRLGLVVMHELAHGLVLASYGREVPRAGLRLVLVFPYIFVDTSESWLEPRRRRIAIAAAGPASDLVLGGVFALGCLLLPEGLVRDILFQLAFAAYVGAFFNLNPFLDRDGYQILVDVLDAPRLRERARVELRRRLGGGGRGDDDPALTRYAWAGVVWSILAAGAGSLLTLRYAPVMGQYAPNAVVWIVLGTVWAALFVPVILTLGRPLLTRRREAAW